MTYDALIEKLMQYFSGPQYAEDVRKAKAEFFDQAGILDEMAGDFELKMAQFVDWFLLDRPIEAHKLSPLQAVREGRIKPDMELNVELLEGLFNGIHSLFEFLKVKGEDVYVKDLFSGKKYVIKKSPVTLGFSRDQLFEARLFPKDDSYEFSRAFCFHPPQVSKILLKEIKKVTKAPESERAAAQKHLLLRFFKLRYKHEQYKHLDVREIYSPDSKLRI